MFNEAEKDLRFQASLLDDLYSNEEFRDKTSNQIQLLHESAKCYKENKRWVYRNEVAFN